ncbi:killer cell lectin-like receptor subfamily I member 2 [Rattus norvegicus]|uniref:Killer cell lectin-like receptor subfamily I member 2 n=1 Tax=Rattus norvegicus TaxID=10116 RepID=KLRI2_RAT|nr:killer cell lectin-like receptor subfamily I member 2 [Rattus norvegicus]Q5DT37.1 RecName: Full=Killer cell lectin-like receptor subfamily I member 2 [Rattus norvegicus]AAR00557.1 killer cell lectin-like receptor family I member 2 [Rattus norvegicus]|eukprot:NP_001012666.1 killer cell lectin-like receptor subfamily I member 2 [Rattus norvegicus]
MPRKKQNERGTNKQEIINIETKSSTFQEKQRQSKTDQISTVWRKEQKKQELKVHTELHPQHRTGFNEDKGTDPWLTTWRIITVILGTSCIILVTKVGFLIPNLFSRGEKRSRELSLLDSLCLKNNDSFCDLCSHDWIAFGNNFYLFFRGTKTWAESKSACEELNSYLLDIDSRAELENLLLFEINGWILFKTDAINRSLRKNYIKIHQTLFNDSEKKNHSCHYLSGNQFSAGDCSSKKAYTCEFNLQ